MSDEAPQPANPIPPTQRLMNLEYLAFRLFINQTDLPALPEEKAPSLIHTVDDIAQPDAPQVPAVRVPYDLAYARAGVEQIIEFTGGEVSVPHMLDAVVKSIKQFNAEAQKVDEDDSDGPRLVN